MKNLILRLSFVFYGIQFIVRIIFLIESPSSALEVPKILIKGLIWDSICWVPLATFIILFLSLPPKKNPSKKVSQFITFTISFLSCFLAGSEMIFWNEFHSRFNFIAVDYLIYTNEVFANILESFPIYYMLIGILTLSLLISMSSFALIPRFIDLKKNLSPSKWILLYITLISGLYISTQLISDHDSIFRNDQISRNGIIEFIRAFKSNEIDYKEFYAIIDPIKANSIMGQKRSQEFPLNIPAIESKPNVIIITVESLGAKFIDPLGGMKNVTPFLNQLSDQSIFFTNFYATGTRTVRGLESINLSLPPTPGYSVVKRPNHKNLYSLGNTFKSNGYENFFLYGGRGFFDNMNSFFSGNGFKVIDQTDLTPEDITFKNAWGVCDEDIYMQAIKTISQRDNQNPFLLFILTTSNHRPFTYPNNKIDIPSGTGRVGAVKYTDYAISSFLNEAKDQPWFKNTVFVIIADHSTEGRGQFELEMEDFHIPLWIYSPQLIKPKIVDKVGSQVDLLPTLIAMLNLNDQSPFFGNNLLTSSKEEARAFIGNYQHIGYYKNNILTTLGPNQKIKTYYYLPLTKEQSEQIFTEYIEETIAFYQTASGMLDSGNYNIDLPKNKQILQ